MRLIFGMIQQTSSSAQQFHPKFIQTDFKDTVSFNLSLKKEAELAVVNKADFVIQHHQLLWFTPQFKAISESRQKKFSQPVIQNKHGRKRCPETSSANSHLMRAKKDV